MLVSKLISFGAEQKDFPIFYAFIRMLKNAFDSSLSTDEFRVQVPKVMMLSDSIERMERNVMKIHHRWDELMVNLEKKTREMKGW